jgi:aconitate hydratase
LAAAKGASYDEEDEIDLSRLEPLIACPSSPGNVVPVREVAGIKVDQVLVGSSVNSSFRDLMVVARLLAGRTAHPGVSVHINPGSRQVMENVMVHGGALDLLRAGAVLNEAGCLGCIGMGQAPGTGQVSLRTVPRNFPGRSGTVGDQVYLCSPETAGAAALTGVITDPRDLARLMEYPRIVDPEHYLVDSASLLEPPEDGSGVEVVRGPNIQPFPSFEALPEELEVTVAIRVGDNISTDAILPGGNRVLPLRSNIPAISQFVFSQIAPDFPARCREARNAAVVGGENYGQGSSREHAAIAPRYLGVRVKIAKSFARIHRANLINFGILPLVLADPADYERLAEGASLFLPGLRRRVEAGQEELPIRVSGATVLTRLVVSPRERRDLLAGGALNAVREHLAS